MSGREEVDLVDSHASVVGASTIEECLSRGLLHRAVAVLVIRPDGRFVLQRRSLGDRWHPGLLTISSTGHVRKGEAYEAAARRELREELGIDGKPELVRKYLMPGFSDKELTEREWVSFYICRAADPCLLDPVEVESVSEVSAPELRVMLRGGPLTPDAKLILSDYLGNPEL